MRNKGRTRRVKREKERKVCLRNPHMIRKFRKQSLKQVWYNIVPTIEMVGVTSMEKGNINLLLI